MQPRGNLLTSRGLAAAIAGRFADGEWHIVDEVVAACGHLIPPEIAVRRIARNWRGDLRASVSEQVELGRRWIILKTLPTLGAEAGGQRLRDKWVRFRLPVGEYGMARGSRHPEALLNEEKVKEIRIRYALGSATQKELAREYGVAPSAISMVVRRKSWRHVA